MGLSNEGSVKGVRLFGNREELLAMLRAIVKRQKDTDSWSDIEIDHDDADSALIAYINDDEVTALYDDIEKWYA